MQIQLNAPRIWLANEAVDFRKGVNGLCEYIAAHYQSTPEQAIYVFYNTARNRLKLLTYHRNGFILIYKQLDKRTFTLKEKGSCAHELNEKQLSWLLAGLDWVEMSGFNELTYDDYF